MADVELKKAGVTLTADIEGNVFGTVHDDEDGDRVMTTGEILVLACFLRAKSDLQWGLQMVDWFDEFYGDKIEKLEKAADEEQLELDLGAPV